LQVEGLGWLAPHSFLELFFLGKRMAVDSERWMVIRFWNYFFSGKRMVTGLVFGIIFFGHTNAGRFQIAD